MTDGEQETVTILPVRVLGAVAQLVGVRHCKDVCDPEGLADVTLALDLPHLQGVVPDTVSSSAEAIEPIRVGRCSVGGCWRGGGAGGSHESGPLRSSSNGWAAGGQSDELAGAGEVTVTGGVARGGSGLAAWRMAFCSRVSTAVRSAGPHVSRVMSAAKSPSRP